MHIDQYKLIVAFSLINLSIILAYGVIGSQNENNLINVHITCLSYILKFIYETFFILGNNWYVHSVNSIIFASFIRFISGKRRDLISNRYAYVVFEITRQP